MLATGQSKMLNGVPLNTIARAITYTILTVSISKYFLYNSLYNPVSINVYIENI